jgi:acetoin utilization protein AcuB
MLVEDLMTPYPVTVTRQTTVRDALDLFDRHSLGCLPVVDRRGALVGVLTRTDVVGFLARTSPPAATTEEPQAP